MQRIVERMFVPVIYSAFGETGTVALRDVLQFLPSHYSNADASLVTGTLVVVRPFASECPGLSGEMQSEKRIDRLPREVRGVVVIELLETGDFRVWQNATIDLAVATAAAVVYRFTPGREDFVVKGASHIVLNPAPEHISVFARATFSSLADALADYGRVAVRSSSCYIFNEAWDSPQRLFFKAGPEWRMRRSLQQFLSNRIRDVDVLPEQNVSETKPIDIKVLWNLTRSEALIEIKWLGKSRSDGKVIGYWDQRARDGAKQLAEYLDMYRTLNPHVSVKGYLVVIDGRRYGMKDDATIVSRENGLHYEKLEVEFDPKYHELREDFQPPVRMFAEPISTNDPPATSGTASQ